MNKRKIIPIPTNKKKFFYQYLRLLQPIFNSALSSQLESNVEMRNKEIAIMAELLYHFFKHKNLSDEDRYKVLFNYDTRIEIRDKIGMGEASFNNHLAFMRKKGMLINNKINPIFLVNPENSCEIVFNFKFEHYEK